MWASLARLIDHSLLSLLAMRRPRYLRDADGPPAETFMQILDRWRDATAELTLEERAGSRERHRIVIRGGGREVDSILYVERCPHPTRRLIVYHHGLGELPPTRSYRALVGNQFEELPADRVVLVAPGHVPGRRDLRTRLARLDGFEEMLACGIVAAKHIVDQFGERYDRAVLAGISLGGIVALAETLYEPRYAANVSILATPFLAAMLLRSSLSRMIDTRFRHRCRYDALRSRIDLDGLVGRNGGRLVMINGRADTMVDLALLRSWWRGRPAIESHEVNVSHLSLVFDSAALGRLLRDLLRRELGVMPTMDGPGGPT